MGPTLGWEVVEWIEEYLCHGLGDIQGTPIHLDDELTKFVLEAYEVFPQDHLFAGQRTKTEAWLSRPKGRAKSELASMLCCAELLGPVRFDGWDAAGEPVGATTSASRYREVLSVATEEGQAGFIYLSSKYMLEHGRAHDTYDLDIGTTRTIVRDGSESLMQPITSGSTSKDGGKSTFVAADETHLWILPELHRLFNTVQQNIVKRRGSWLCQTTTMFQPGEGSVAEGAYEYAQAVMRGDVPHTGFLFDHREAPPEVDIEDDDQLRAALEYVYGDAAEWTNVDGIIQLFRDPRRLESDNRRYFLNQPTKGASKAIDPARWDDLQDKKRIPALGSDLVVAFDGSDRGQGGDHTVLIGWTVEAKPHLFLIERWVPEKDPRTNEWKINRRKVRQAVKDLFANYNVRRFVADPPYWREQIDEWDDTYGMDANGEPIVLEFMSNQAREMGEAIDRFLEAIAERNFTHDGSPELRSYALNAVLTTLAGRSRAKVYEKEKEHLKIDGIVAATFGYHELANNPPAPVPTFFGAWS